MLATKCIVCSQLSLSIFDNKMELYYQGKAVPIYICKDCLKKATILQLLTMLDKKLKGIVEVRI